MWIPPLPLTITDEEIDELLQGTSTPTDYSITSSHRKGYAAYEYAGYKSYTRHEWKPILLLNSTVYDCKHCGAKQEKTTGVYCDEDTF
jgi:hypothetical protein